MFWFIVGIIIAICGVLCFVALPFAKGEDGTSYRPVVAIAGTACMVIFVLFWFLGGLKSVPTKSIGVPVSFGKITGTPYGPGLHSTWKPWMHLAIIDETIQTTTFEVDQKTGQGGLDVRIGGQQTARLDRGIWLTVRREKGLT